MICKAAASHIIPLRPWISTFVGANTVAGDTRFGSTLNIYESSPLPESVQGQFYDVSDYISDEVNYGILPENKLLALTDIKSRYSNANTVTITDIRTGDLVKAYEIQNPFAAAHAANVYDSTHFMLFYRSEELGSAYIHLFNVKE